MTGSLIHEEPEAHLDPSEVARHVARTAPPAERAKVEAHLAVCQRCTDDVVAAWRFARRRPRWGVVGAGLAAAAVLAGLLLLPPGRAPSRADRVVRGIGRDTAQVLAVVAPRDGDTVAGPVVLTWRSRPDMATYKMSLAVADGDSVWAVITEDTTVTLPDSVHIAPGLTYLWYVDGLQADGRALTSGIHQFRLRQ